MLKPKIKICCIKSIVEAEAVIEAGASAIGLVGNMPSGPGIIHDDQIAKIAAQVPKHIQSFLLTSELTAQDIIAHYQLVGTTTIQIVDYIGKEELQKLRAGLPKVELVQVIHVEDHSSIELAESFAPLVDTILLDSGNTKLSVKELGGTGRTHDWSISKRIVNQLDIPVYLAGGINADNVVSAIEYVQPYGLDLCSGVRDHDLLDKKKLNAFFNVVMNYEY